jgi:putative nucleotidyltransferase with HDIG domain
MKPEPPDEPNAAVPIEISSRLERTLESLRKALDGAVEIIAAITDARDPYTAGHERRVAALATAIALELGLPEKRREGMRVIGYVHDIGKIAVPAEILSKPTPLNQHERGIICLHPDLGYEILHNLDFPWPVAEAIRQHHERLDGSGYPVGLKGARSCSKQESWRSAIQSKPCRATGPIARPSGSRGRLAKSWPSEGRGTIPMLSTPVPT